MRIIGQIDHPVFKISVFRMDNRISLKFENEGYEQTFKLGTDERTDTLEKVQQLVDAAFLEAVATNFQHMHRCRLEAFSRAFPPEAHAFEEII
jgi:hypothetical protein